MISPSTRPIRSSLPSLQIALDCAIICAAYALLGRILGASPLAPNYQSPLLASVVFVVIGQFFGIFHSQHHRPADYDVLAVSGAWGAGFVTSHSLGFVLDPIHERLDRDGLVQWFVLTWLVILLAHLVARGLMSWMNERGWETRRCAILGDNQLGWQVAESASGDRDLGLNIVGVFDEAEFPSDRRDPKGWGLSKIPRGEVQVLGGFEDLVVGIRGGSIDTVFISVPMSEEKQIRTWIDRLADTTASVYLVPNFDAFDSLYNRWGSVGGHTVISVFETPIFGIDGYLKRCMDVTLSIIALLLAAPVMLAAGLAIKLTSRGPVFFLQRRYGLDGKEFHVWKFRTMSTMENGEVVKQATKDDPRVTRVGRFLRRTSLDELPQLFNVLEGTMSLVGPRPYAIAHNEQFRSLIRGYMLRHKVKPGITGLAQVLGSRLETDTVEKMLARIELDHRYIRDWSLWLDLKIMVKTIAVVLRQEAH